MALRFARLLGLGALAPFVLLASGFVACGTSGISTSEIPEQKIVIRYFTNEEARRRAEMLAEVNETARAPQKQGVASVDSVRSYVEKLLGTGGVGDEGMERRFPGRVAVLNPHTLDVETIESARRGSVPRDLSADGRRLLFTQTVGRFRQIFEYDFERADVRTITRAPGVHPDACYGSEGRIALVKATVRDERAVATIELTGPGGVGREVISDGPGDYSIACAPDGSAIAWVSQRRRSDHIMVRSPMVGGENRSLGRGRFPAFSPDSQWIVYSQKVGDHWTLYRVRPDGSGRKRVGGAGLDEIHGEFSPDGRLIIYVGDDGFNQNLYLLRFDGTGDRVLLGEGGAQHPIW